MSTAAEFRFDAKMAQQLSMIYQTEDIREMQRRIALCFADHHGDGWMGRRLYSLCEQAGARQIELYPYVIHNTEYSARRYGGPLSLVIRDYLLRTQKCSEGEIQRWLQLLSAACDERTYFFSLTRMVCILRK